jgi:hypothetical protein
MGVISTEMKLPCWSSACVTLKDVVVPDTQAGALFPVIVAYDQAADTWHTETVPGLPPFSIHRTRVAF